MDTGPYRTTETESANMKPAKLVNQKLNNALVACSLSLLRSA